VGVLFGRDQRGLSYDVVSFPWNSIDLLHLLDKGHQGVRVGTLAGQPYDADDLRVVHDEDTGGALGEPERVREGRNLTSSEGLKGSRTKAEERYIFYRSRNTWRARESRALKKL